MNTATERNKKYKPYPEYKDSDIEWVGERFLTMPDSDIETIRDLIYYQSDYGG